MPTILVVDENLQIRELVRYILEIQGYRVEEASNGKAALAYLKQVEPNLIVLDLFLGGIDGREIIAYARSRSRSIKILAVSGIPFDGHKMGETAKFLGAHDVLAKPFDTTTLLQRIETLLAHP